MKLSRVLAGTAGVALVGASAFAFAAPASAAEIAPPAVPLPLEGASYTANWFEGGGSNGAAAYNAAGLVLTHGTDAGSTGLSYQILHGVTTTETSVENLAGDAFLYVTEGAASFQLAVFGEPSATAGPGNPKQFTTLRPADAVVPGASYLGSADAQWITSQALGGIPAGGSATLAEFDEVLNAGEPTQILAIGAAVGGNTSAAIARINFNGDTYNFRAAATGTQSATTVPLAQYNSTGVVLTIAGLVPGEPVILGASTPDSGGSAEVGEALDDGTFTYTAQGSPEFVSSLGLYEFSLNGVNSGSQFNFAFTVVADVAAVPAPATPAQLAATGTELSSGIIAGGILLLAGAGFALVATRRRLGNQA